LVYVLVAVMRRAGFGPRTYGSLIEASTGEPLSYALVVVRDADTGTETLRTVADHRGRYYALVPNGHYVVEVAKKEQDLSYTPVYRSPDFAVSKGVIDREWRT
jgi:hypothetical protein